MGTTAHGLIVKTITCMFHIASKQTKKLVKPTNIRKTSFLNAVCQNTEAGRTQVQE